MNTERSEAYGRAMEELAYRRDKEAKNYKGTGLRGTHLVPEMITAKVKLQYLLDECRLRANKHNREFDLTINDLYPYPVYCKYLKLKLNYDNPCNKENNLASIDRIDNNLGYIKGNVQIVSWKANNKKQQMSDNEFVEYLLAERRKAT